MTETELENTLIEMLENPTCGWKFWRNKPPTAGLLGKSSAECDYGSVVIRTTDSWDKSYALWLESPIHFRFYDGKRIKEAVLSRMKQDQTAREKAGRQDFIRIFGGDPPEKRKQQ